MNNFIFNRGYKPSFCEISKVLKPLIIAFLLITNVGFGHTIFTVTSWNSSDNESLAPPPVTDLSNLSNEKVNVTAAPTILAPGDLVIIAQQSATVIDQFAFVLLRDIDAGTVINFTDNGMATPTTGRLGEGFLIYTAPANFCAGTVIAWQTDALSAPAISLGWNTNSGATSNFQLNTGGDNIFAFQGTSSNWASQTGITVLFGALTGVPWSPTSATTTQTSCVPSALSATFTYNFPANTTTDVYLNLTAANFIGTPAQIIANIKVTSNFTAGTSVFTMPAYNSFLIAPDISALSANSICLGAVATVVLTAASLAAGSYAVTYTLSGANTVINSTATIILASGTGSFTVSGLTNSGITTLTINKINNGCDKGLSPNTVALIVGANSIFNGSWDVAPNATRNLVFASNYNSAAVLNACECTVNTGINVVIASGGVVNLSKNLKVNGTGTFTLNNNASLVQADNTAINSGNIKVDRTTSTYENFDYIYWSSPVAGATVGTSFATWRLNRAYQYLTSNFSDLFSGAYPQSIPGSDSFDDNGDDWQNVSIGTAMIPGKGYIVMAPFTAAATTASVSFNGTPNNGIVTFPLVLSANNASNTDDFNLVGNPYPSALDADSFINANIIAGGASANNISGTLYFWTYVSSIQPVATNPGPQANNFNSNDYATYTLAGGVGVASGSGSTIPLGKIASGQGFFVEAETTNNLVFNNSMRSASYLNNQFYRTNNNSTQTETEKDRLRLNFQNVDKMFSQQLIGYFDNASMDYDYGYDGVVSESQNYVSFYSLMPNNEELYRIQAQSRWNKKKTISLGYSSSVSGSSSISIGSIGRCF
jgi:hypothetical protein